MGPRAWGVPAPWWTMEGRLPYSLRGGEMMAGQAPEGRGDEEFPREEGEEADDVIQQCVEDSNECSLVCTETVTYALQMGGAHVELPVVRTLMDCADACQLSSTLLLRRSELAVRMCTLTAEICEQCAERCDQFLDDQWMVECSETCRRCAES